MEKPRSMLTLRHRRLLFNSGVPTAFLIGRDGRIIWRGHPLSLDVERKIEELIK